MSDHTKIYLQPECCAGEDTGRLWCQDNEPESCPDGEKWTSYILQSEYDRLQSDNEALRERVAVQEDTLYSIAVGLKEAGNLSKEMHDLIVSANQGDARAWLLRKQAEAVEALASKLSGTRNQKLAASEVASLRLQANEAKK